MITPDGRDLIKRSWKLCVVPGDPEYNLAYDTLTSRATRKNLRTYLKEDPILANEIKARLGSCVLEELPGDIPETGDIAEGEDVGDDIGDDTDVSLTDVIRVALGDGLAPVARSEFDVDRAGESEDGGLSAANEEDDIWAYDDQGHMWNDLKAGPAPENQDANSDDDES
ncbi:hypothetical protein B0H15DRAFT_1004764 [Mycena belliarum]|uniref:Uncharacterized protein n=1 Tax=Mycena belliarum TaxID=1033014 RepID=A0AAD6TVC2_9AGAR|nr:hypothetical protein B0H15DRAFT_1004764 [Mycena belliae]